MKKGFTLIELLIVIMIVAILAAAAIPMMRANVNRARAAEAVAALGMIKNAERAYYSQYETYTDNWVALGLNGATLSGAYFSNGCYTLTNTATTFTATCNPSASTGVPYAGQVTGLANMTINQTGYINNPN